MRHIFTEWRWTKRVVSTLQGKFLTKLRQSGNPRIITQLVSHFGNLNVITFIFSWDGTIKFFENPLESKRYLVLLHEREIEALFCDENLIFYCGDNKGGVIGFNNGKFMYRRRNIVEAIKLLHVEKLFYTLTDLGMTIHEMDDETGKFTMKGSVNGKFPVTFFGMKPDGTSKFIAITTPTKVLVKPPTDSPPTDPIYAPTDATNKAPIDEFRFDNLGVTVFKNDFQEKFHRLTIKENLHEFPIVAMKGKGDYLFTGDEEGNIIKSRIICRYEGNEIKEEAHCETGQQNANCIAVADENTIFIGSGDGTVKKIVF